MLVFAVYSSQPQIREHSGTNIQDAFRNLYYSRLCKSSHTPIPWHETYLLANAAVEKTNTKPSDEFWLSSKRFTFCQIPLLLIAAHDLTCHSKTKVRWNVSNIGILFCRQSQPLLASLHQVAFICSLNFDVDAAEIYSSCKLQSSDIRVHRLTKNPLSSFPWNGRVISLSVQSNTLAIYRDTPNHKFVLRASRRQYTYNKLPRTIGRRYPITLPNFITI